MKTTTTTDCPTTEYDLDTDAFEPDTDDDGIRDGLYASPTVADVFCSGDNSTIDQDISSPAQCAAPVKVIIETNTDILASDDLLIASLESEFRPGFGIRAGGGVTVHAAILPRWDPSGSQHYLRKPSSLATV